MTILQILGYPESYTQTLLSTKGILPERLVRHMNTRITNGYSTERTIEHLKRNDELTRQKDRPQVRVDEIKKRRMAKHDHEESSEDEPESEVESRHLKRKREVKESSAEDEKRERETLCFNCNNYGHTAEECRSHTCGWCFKSNTGHTSYNCPDREIKCPEYATRTSTLRDRP